MVSRQEEFEHQLAVNAELGEDVKNLKADICQLDIDYKVLEEENTSLSNEAEDLVYEMSEIKGTLKDCISRLNCIVGELEYLV